MTGPPAKDALEPSVLDRCPACPFTADTDAEIQNHFYTMRVVLRDAAHCRPQYEGED